MGLKQIYQTLTKEAVDYLANVQLMHENKFECLIYQTGGSTLARALFTISGTSIMKFYIQEVEIPRPVFEMERVNNMTYLKDIKYPETFSIKLLEDEKGTVIRFIEYWRSSFYGKGALGGVPGVGASKSVSDSTANDSYYPGFKKDMYDYKANMILKMIGVNDELTALLYPSVSFHGIIPIEIKPITVKQDGDSHLMYDITFSVDDIATNIA